MHCVTGADFHLIALPQEVPINSNSMKIEPKEVKRTAKLVESLMGRKPELRLAYIQENAKFARDLDV